MKPVPFQPAGQADDWPSPLSVVWPLPIIDLSVLLRSVVITVWVTYGSFCRLNNLPDSAIYLSSDFFGGVSQ